MKLGRVDALEPNPFAGDDDRIAIDDRRRAGYVGERRPGESSEEQARTAGRNIKRSYAAARAGDATSGCRSGRDARPG